MKKKMAIFCGANKPLRIDEIEVAPPAKGMAGLNLVSSGICGTDVHIYQGRLGMPDFELVLGHEFIGEIDRLGEGSDEDALGSRLRPGDRAVACVAVACGKCFNCSRGETASCLAFGVTYVKPVADPPHFHGGFAEYLFSPTANLVKIPEDVDPIAAAAFPCGGPTVIRSTMYGGGLEPGEIVVIQGNGSLGMFALAWAKAHGCTTVMVGSTSIPERVRLTEALQPDLFLDFRGTDGKEIKARVDGLAESAGRGDGADVVIETSGAKGAFPAGLELLRTRGRYFVPGQYSDNGPVAIAPQLITFRALQIFGSGQYTFADIGVYLKFLQDNPDLQPLFAEMVAMCPVAEANKAMGDAIAGRKIKVALGA